MTVYIDDAAIPWRGSVWFHLQADTEDELHAFAAKLGLLSRWFQRGSRPEAAHYDVCGPRRRDRAIRLGAVPETVAEGADRRRKVRKEREVPAPRQP